MPVDDRDRSRQLRLWHGRQDTIEEAEHLSVGVRATAEQDDAGSVSVLEGEQPRIVEIGGHDNPSLRTGGFNDLAVGCSREPYRGGVDGFMPGPPEVLDRVGRHGHVHEKSHPLNSMTSSSARLAA